MQAEGKDHSYQTRPDPVGQPRTRVTRGLERVCFIQNLGLQLAREKLFDSLGQLETWVSQQNLVEI